MPTKADILLKLRRDILPLQGFKPILNDSDAIDLGPIKNAFPNAVFPLGAVHEFVSFGPENTAATMGFVSGVLKNFMGNTGVALWISSSRLLFPPALASFGIDPGKIIFIDLNKEKDCILAMEEALKCEGIAAVMCETRDLTFTASRRFQLAVEQSRVTGFVLRQDPR